MERKIYIVDGGMGMGAGTWMGTKFVKNMEDADLVVFTGGQDINPSLYGEPRHPLTHYSQRRDDYEVTEFKKAQSMGKNLLGICRGAQLLCAMAGGKLVQHQENNGSHVVHRNDIEFGPDEYLVTSCHHQAQYPWGLPYGDWTLLGHSIDQSFFHEDGNKKELLEGMAHVCEWGGGRAGNSLVEVEDVYYGKIKALAIQSHPEWCSKDSPTIAHYRKLLDAMEAGDL